MIGFNGAFKFEYVDLMEHLIDSGGVSNQLQQPTGHLGLGVLALVEHFIDFSRAFEFGHIEICVPLAVTCGPPIHRGPQASHRYLKRIAGVTQIFKMVSVNAIIDCRPTVEMETQGSILVSHSHMASIKHRLLRGSRCLIDAMWE